MRFDFFVSVRLEIFPVKKPRLQLTLFMQQTTSFLSNKSYVWTVNKFVCLLAWGEAMMLALKHGQQQPRFHPKARLQSKRL